MLFCRLDKAYEKRRWRLKPGLELRVRLRPYSKAIGPFYEFDELLVKRYPAYLQSILCERLLVIVVELVAVPVPLAYFALFVPNGIKGLVFLL